jgi:hypothetical protein
MTNVVRLEVKSWVSRRILQIRQVAGHEVVDPDDLEALGQQAIDEMRP